MSLTYQEAFFYENLLTYLFSPELLDANVFPRRNPDCSKRPIFRKVVPVGTVSPTKGGIEQNLLDDNGISIADHAAKIICLFACLDLKRVCSRCSTVYRLRPEGEYVQTPYSDCVYHFGKAWKREGAVHHLLRSFFRALSKLLIFS